MSEDGLRLARDWAVEPGTVLLRMLEQRGLRQTDLAERTGLTAKHVNQIAKNKVPISGDVAVSLGRALNVPARFWTRLTADFEAEQSVMRANENLRDYGAWGRRFDRATLIRHGIINTDDQDDAKVDKLLRFFGVATPGAFEDTYMRPRVSFRRAQSFQVEEPNTALWLRLVELKAQPESGQDLNMSSLRRTATALPRMSTLPVVEGFVTARDALASAGVRLVFVSEVPQTRLCAATWWFGNDRPVIGLTERHKRVDTLWFNLLHEVGHVLLHPRRTTFLDLDEAMKSDDGAEHEANRYAQDALIPPDHAAELVAAQSRDDLARLAVKLGVGLSVVAGQYAHRTGAYSAVAADRVKITPRDVEKLAAL